MDTLVDRYRKILEDVLADYAQVRYAFGQIETETVFDRQRDHYLLMNVGWDQGRIHGRASAHSA